MARLARLVIPGLPHHVTQRGNGRAQTFFGDADYTLYRDLLAESCRAADVAIWSWVLMPNHVHLILVPAAADGLRRALAPVHARYAGAVQARLGRTGHFWQGRFGAVVMDEAHLAAAVRYVALNPVRAGLVRAAGDWPWSSVPAHLAGLDDGMTAIQPILDRFPDFGEFIVHEGLPTCSGGCAAPKPSADRLATRVSSARWKPRLGARSGRESADRSPARNPD